MAAANKIKPCDVITVPAGVYGEEVVPPRGGVSEDKRIIYQAAKGGKVTITGPNIFKNWEKVSGDFSKLVIFNSYFGKFNPYPAKVYGGWFDFKGRTQCRGNIFLNGVWTPEALNLESVNVGSKKSTWFSVVNGL